MTKEFDPNSGNSNPVTLTAQWHDDNAIPTGACTGTYGSQVNVNLSVNSTQNFDYTGNVQCAYLQKTGYYKLEVWGGAGSQVYTYTSKSTPGYGGYAFGNIYALENSAVYVVVGGSGKTSGYNGGGGSASYRSSYSSNEPGFGGGATHIATKTGILSSFSSSTSSVLIVAGGGGASGQDSESGGNGGGSIGGQGSDSNAKACDNCGKGGTCVVKHIATFPQN